MTRKPSVQAAALVAAALSPCLAAGSAEARMRFLPGPLAGTALAIGGLAVGGTALAFARARACRRDPACPGYREPPAAAPGTIPPVPR